MPAEIRVFRCLSDNIGALIHDPATGACAALDAPEEAPIIKALEETGWTLSEIIVTHRHADHVQAIEPLKRRTGCRVVAPEKARGQVPAVDAYVREGDTVRVGELAAHVWETPGAAGRCARLQWPRLRHRERQVRARGRPGQRGAESPHGGGREGEGGRPLPHPLNDRRGEGDEPLPTCRRAGARALGQDGGRGARGGVPGSPRMEKQVLTVSRNAG